MANYFWKGGIDTESQTAGNWVTTSDGSTAHTSIPGSDDDLFFDLTSTRDCIFTSDTVTYNSIEIGEDFGHQLSVNGSTITITKHGSSSYENAGQLIISGVKKITCETASTFVFTSANNGAGVEYSTNSDIDEDLGVFANNESRQLLTFHFNYSGLTTLVLGEGVYPNITLTNAKFSPVTSTVSSPYQEVKMLAFTVNSSSSVQPHTSISATDLDKIYRIEGDITCSSDTFKWGKSILKLAPVTAGEPFPFDGNIASFGTGTPKVFNAEYYDLRIIPLQNQSTNYFNLTAGALISVNSFTVESSGRIYGPSSGSSAEVHTLKKPTVRGDWNFQRISDGVYRSITRKPLLNITQGGTGLDAIGEAGRVLAVHSSGEYLEWSATAGGTSRTVTVDTDGDGSADATLGASETLMLKKGSNITLAESGGVVTISSTDTDTNTNQLTTFTLRGTTNTNPTTVNHGDTITIAAGTGISTTSTSDGVITIVNTVTDTNDDVSIANLKTKLAGGFGSNAVTIGDSDDVVTIGNDLIVTGDLTVNGDTTTVDTATLSVEDPLIILASGNNAADTVDIGFYGLYDTSGSQDLYAGLFRDANDSGKFKLFKDLQAVPTTTVDTSGTGYAVATLVANLEGAVTGNVTGNVSGTAATVTGAAQSNITSVGTLTSLTVSGDINLTGGDIFLAQEKKIQFDSGDTHITTNADNPEDLFISVDQDLFLRPDNDVLIQVGTTTYAIFDGANQRVGIGTTSPAHLLDVDGDGRFGTTGVAGKLYLSADSAGSYLGWNATGNDITLRADDDLVLRADDDLFFQAGGATKMTLLDSGNLGIGVGFLSPSTELHVSGASHPSIRVTGTDNSAADPAIELLGTADDFSEGGQLWYDNGTGVLHLASIYNNDAADIQFHTKTAADRSTSNVRMTIAGDGNVGIGTTDPDKLLHVVGSANDETVALFSTTGGTSGSVQGKVHIGMSHFSSDANPSVSFTAEEIDTGDYRADLIFNTRSATSDSAPAERMRITHDGNIGIGTTDPDGFLHIKHTDNTGVPGVIIECAASAAQSDAVLRLKESHGASSFIDFTLNTFGQLEITGGASTRRQIFTADDPDTDDLGIISLNKDHYEWDTQIFGDSSTPVIFIDGTNNRMGVGTTSPSEKLTVDGNISTTGNLSVAGNLTISGTTTTLNTATLTVEDNIIVLNSNVTGTPADVDAGIEVERGDETNPQFLWDEGGDYWQSISPGTGHSFIAKNANGYIALGPQNTSYAHITTDRSRFYFNRDLVIGENAISSYNGDFAIRRSQSTDEQITIADNSMTFTSAGNDVVKLDGSNQRLGIKQTSPQHTLDVAGSVFIGNSNETTALTGSATLEMKGDSALMTFKADNASSGDQIAGIRVFADHYRAAGMVIGDYDNSDGSTTEDWIFGRQYASSNKAGIMATPENGGDEYITVQSHSQKQVIIANDSDDIDLLVKGTGGTYLFGQASSGNLGIGTTSPDAPLHVEHTSGLIAKFGEGNVETRMQFADARAMIGYVGDSLMLQGGSGSKIIRFAVNNGTFGSGEVARFDVNGNFGINTTNPGHLLEVAGGGANGEIVVNRTSGAEILLQAQSATGVIGTSTNHDLAIKTNGSTRMQIENGGNVGIGDTTPSYKLDVNGSIRAVDDIYTDKLIASEGIRSSSRASFNTMQMYYFDRESMGTSAVFLRVPVGGSSSANPGSYAMPHAGQVMQVMYQFYGSTFGTGTDTWKVIRTDTNGNTAECDFTIAHGDVNQIGSTTNRNILKDISALDDSITFAAGDILQIQRSTANINLTHVNAQLWVVFDI